MYLIYINRIGTTFKGEHLFEFLFSKSTDWEWDDGWYESSVMTETRDLCPDENMISMVGSLKTDLYLNRLRKTITPGTRPEVADP